MVMIFCPRCKKTKKFDSDTGPYRCCGETLVVSPVVEPIQKMPTKGVTFQCPDPKCKTITTFELGGPYFCDCGREFFWEPSDPKTHPRTNPAEIVQALRSAGTFVHELCAMYESAMQRAEDAEARLAAVKEYCGGSRPASYRYSDVYAILSGSKTK